jgi:hypothetical protein
LFFVVAIHRKIGKIVDVMTRSSSSSSIPPRPADWAKGFQKGRYRIACAGKEIPCYHPVYGWMVLVYDIVGRKHIYYFYKSDSFNEDGDRL